MEHLEIRDGYVKMIDASCPDKACQGKGYIPMRELHAFLMGLFLRYLAVRKAILMLSPNDCNPMNIEEL